MTYTTSGLILFQSYFFFVSSISYAQFSINDNIKGSLFGWLPDMLSADNNMNIIGILLKLFEKNRTMGNDQNVAHIFACLLYCLSFFDLRLLWLFICLFAVFVFFLCPLWPMKSLTPVAVRYSIKICGTFTFLHKNTTICKSLFVLLSFSFWPLCFLFFFDLIFWLHLWYLQTLLETVTLSYMATFTDVRY